MLPARSLIFDWPGRHVLHLALPIALLVAAALHAGIFFCFSIVYPSTASTAPKHARVYYVPAESGLAVPLAALLRSSDPAVFAPGRQVEQLPRATYTPQYASPKLPLAILPPPEMTQDRGQLGRFGALTAPLPKQIKATKPLPTALVGSDRLVRRLPDLPAGHTFAALAGQVLEPTTFLVGVRADGEVAHAILQSGSGNTRLDVQALTYLRKLRFVADGASLMWGTITFAWGGDVEASEAQ